MFLVKISFASNLTVDDGKFPDVIHDLITQSLYEPVYRILNIFPLDYLL
jgi:hypothetical protein